MTTTTNKGTNTTKKKEIKGEENERESNLLSAIPRRVDLKGFCICLDTLSFLFCLSVDLIPS